MAEQVNLTLTGSDALVLFEFLSRFGGSDELTIEDPAEERALWDLTAQLEKVLVEPFDPNWVDILARARRRVRGE